ncbi:winged helix-turn-helix transcriptional regulator [Pedobacter sp. MR2016-19]|nr:winged helix-turn-helix transcriptional regulator [Pedobacter sp. MR2016-19]
MWFFHPKVEYFLTDLGRELMHLIIQLGTWGEDHKLLLQDLVKESITYL